MRRTVALLASGAAVVLATSCSGESEGQPEPAPSSAGASATTSSADASEGASDLPHSGAPKVTNPLPESVLSGDPCDALTRDQLDEIFGEGTPTGERNDLEETGPRCDWNYGGGGVTVGFLTVTGEGLSRTYANMEGLGETLDEPGPVQGFPSVTHQTESASCGASVGIADEYAISTGISLSANKEDAGTDPCEAALRVADMVVGNLKEKA
ncbi:Protein of unknown function (DUF3558) [Prauserella aidingensis]|uniref:DUF3558 domain-containing protein n=1 Tax=Prauserella aidingensis TaxID=387890 RepID=UPI0020A3EECC|nr:DUF3558 domain-containing protein [Prauserella aidingensis]MCP2254886.1 Protein of unknown function (DUF3558) [Prauserella aidingensis]MCP2255611.1 Protein of unknown function (DUF3558) [Prauserella aidingensis]